MNGYQPEFAQEISEKVATCSRKTPTYTIKDEQDEIIRDKVYRKLLIKVFYTRNLFTVELVSNTSTQLLSDNSPSLFENVLPEQLKLECQWDAGISKKPHPSMYKVVIEGKFRFLD